MAPEVFIYIRQTLDWRDAALVEQKIIPAFRPRFELWNATFNLPYHEFRQRLRDITDLNLSRIPNAKVTELKEIPSGAFVVPTDDDDWLSPELADGLRAAYDPKYMGYLWKGHSIQPPRSASSLMGWVLWRLRGKRFLTCGSNSYAVLKDEVPLPVIQKHSLASRAFDAEQDRVNRLSGRWAIRNRTLASQTAMKNLTNRAQLIEGYERYRNIYADLSISSAYGWCKPYVAMMADLMSELEVR